MPETNTYSIVQTKEVTVTAKSPSEALEKAKSLLNGISDSLIVDVRIMREP